MGWTATISILQKEQGNRDSGTNFQDIFLRLKIGLTLGLSWEKPEQMKSSYINCSQEHASGHGTRLRDTDWLANTASLFQLRSFFYRSHFKAIKVTLHSLKNVPCNFMGASTSWPLKAFTSLNWKLKRVVGEKAAAFEVSPLSSFIWQIPAGVDTWLAKQGPGSLSPRAYPSREAVTHTHTDMWSQSCAPGRGADRDCKRKLAPACVGKEGNSLSGETHGMNRNQVRTE